MKNEIIAIIILVAMIAGFQSKRVPMGITATLAALAMGFTGVMNIGDCVKSFGGETYMTVLGLQTMGIALTSTGVACLIGNFINRSKWAVKNERVFLLVTLIAISLLSAFLSNSVLLLLFMPIVNAVARNSGGTIREKALIMPLAVGSMVGGVFTMIGTQPQLIAQSLLEQNGCETMGFFTPGLVTIPIFLWMLLYYMTCGYKLQNKTFDFSPAANAGEPEEYDYLKEHPLTKHGYIAIIILGVYVLLAILGVFTLGTSALMCACLCVVTGCIDFGTLVRKVDWNTLFVIGGALGVAEGMKQSGALDLIATGLLGVMGGESASPYVLLLFFILLSGLIGNIMSNNATVALLCPLAISVALSIGVNPMAFAVAVAVVPAYSNATPVANPCMTLSLSAGYRFKDYVVTGIPFALVSYLITLIWIPLSIGF